MSNYVHVYPNMSNLGGAQKVLMQLKKHFGGLVCSFDDFNDLHQNYKVDKNEFIKANIVNLLRLKKSVIISHHRKTTTLMMVINYLFHRKNHIIHISHNEFYNLSHVTLFPKNVIAVSKRVQENLIQYFGVHKEDIEVIYNGLPDVDPNNIERNYNSNSKKPIKIIYAARVNQVKQQILVAKIVNKIRPDKVHVYFAGDGPQVEELKSLCGYSSTYIGSVDNVSTTFMNYDYLMLFSKNEGLPLSIIEAHRSGLPVICNDVGGNCEIVDDSITGYVVNEVDELECFLRDLDREVNTDYLKVSTNARHKYESVFQEKTMLASYEKYINSILNH